MSEPQFSTWSGMPGRFSTAWQQLYDANVAASAADQEDMTKVMAALDDEYNQPLTTSADEEQAVWDRFEELKTAQRAAWDELWGYWNLNFKADVANTTTLYDAAMVWKEDVPEQLGDHESTISSSPARMEWTGPGAEAYSEKLPDQVLAMTDLKQHVRNAAYGVEQGAFVLGGVYTAIFNEVENLTDAISGLDGDATGETFGVRVYNATLWMEDQLELLRDYRSGVGIWDGQTTEASTAMTSSAADAEVLDGPAWPVASSESMQDMHPGTPTDPSTNQPLPPPAVPEEETPQPVPPETDVPTPPAPEDPSNLDRTDTRDVGDEGND